MLLKCLNVAKLLSALDYFSSTFIVEIEKGDTEYVCLSESSCIHR